MSSPEPAEAPDLQAAEIADQPVADAGIACCWNCGDEFLPSPDPWDTFCSETCVWQFRQSLGA